MKALSSAVLLLVFSVGCAQSYSDHISVRLEVGYPMLGTITGEERVWAVYRSRIQISEELIPGDSIVAFLDCANATCSVSRIAPKSAEYETPSAGPKLFGRIIKVSQDRRESAILVEPFPVKVSTEVFEDLKFRPQQVALVDVEYTQTKQGLSFKAIRPAGVVSGQAVRWK